jgi:hypothetical protein
LNKEGEAEWKNEGGSLKRHESSMNVHPKCSYLCVGWQIFTENRGKNRTESHVSEPTNDDTSEGTQSTKRSRTHTDFEAGPMLATVQEVPPLPIYHLLFIQDPDWRKAQETVFHGHEAVWTKTTITKERWLELAANKGSEDFMHRCEPNQDDDDVVMDDFVNVYIDEWVGTRVFLCRRPRP